MWENMKFSANTGSGHTLTCNIRINFYINSCESYFILFVSFAGDLLFRFTAVALGSTCFHQDSKYFNKRIDKNMSKITWWSSSYSQTPTTFSISFGEKFLSCTHKCSNRLGFSAIDVSVFICQLNFGWMFLLIKHRDECLESK